jgi:hypothetical protein
MEAAAVRDMKFGSQTDNCMKALIHLTLNSGKVNQQPILPVQALTRQLRSFLEDEGGTFPPPFDAYRVETDMTETGVALEYYKGNVPILTSVGTWCADVTGEYWSQVEDLYYQVTDVFPQGSWAKRLPKMPETAPWLATLLLPRYFTDVASSRPAIGFLNASEVLLFLVAHNLVHSQ